MNCQKWRDGRSVFYRFRESCRRAEVDAAHPLDLLVRELGEVARRQNRGADDIAEDAVTLEEEEEDTKELDNNCLRIRTLQFGKSVKKKVEK